LVVRDPVSNRENAGSEVRIDPHTHARNFCGGSKFDSIRGALSPDSVISRETTPSPLYYLGRSDPSLSRGLWCTIELWHNAGIQGVFKPRAEARLQGSGPSFDRENGPDIYSPSRRC
jgi:hypothetical protein